MPFVPRSFYRLAGELFAMPEEDEARFRTIVSRAYYSAFLVAREAAKIRTTSMAVHDEVITHYLRSKPQVSNRLNQLRQERNEADYNVNVTVQRRDAGESLRKANRIVTEIEGA